jgi:hypothetical protein
VDHLPINVNLVLQHITLIILQNHVNNVTPHAKNVIYQPQVVLRAKTSFTLIAQLNHVKHAIPPVLIVVDHLQIIVNLVLLLFILMVCLNHANNVTLNVKNAMVLQQVVLHVMIHSILKVHPILVKHVILHV